MINKKEKNVKIIKKSTLKKSNVKKKTTKKKPSKKGFTLIEILAVIIIIGIVAIIAIPSVSKYLGSSKTTAYTSYEHSMEDAAKNKIIDCLSDNSNCDLPENGEEAKIYLDLLIEEGYLDNMKDPESKSFCEQLISYVSIIGDNESNYKYQACLYCGDYYTENDECRKIEGDQENPTCGTAIGESTRWTNQNRTITIGCSDPSSGCLQTVFSKTFTKTTPEGKGNITIRDRSGNTTACEVNAYVDKDLPTCNIKGEGEYIDSVGWYSLSATAKIEDMDDEDSGLLTYGMGTSIKNKEYNKQNSLTLGSGITTVIGYVKDIAGNEGICSRDFRVGTEVPKYNMYYGYQIYPAKETYSLSGITESETTLTTVGENPTITFSGLDKYKNVEKIKIKLNNQIEVATNAKVTYNGKTAQGVMSQGLSEIVVNLEKGTYSNIAIQLGNIDGKKYNIKSIELLTSDGSTWTNKDMTLNIEPIDKGMKTTEVSYENGAASSWVSQFEKTFANATSNKVVTRNDILMESEKKDYTMRIDKTLPIVSIKATKKISGTNVPTNTWVNEGLNFVFTQEASGSSGAKIYYCQDTTNTCTPNIEIPSGQVVTNYNNITTNYYIRFVTKSISGVEGITNSYFAKYDTTKPVCTFASAPTVNVNRTATLDLNCTDTQSGVVNNNLSASSFTLNNNNMSIESVTKSTITNGIKYTLTLKGAHHGNTSITLNSNTVSDIALNKNNSATINDIKVNGVFKVTLNNQSAATAGTTLIYEKYNVGWFSDDVASNPITSITKPTKVGYTFNGYFTGTNGVGTQIIDANGNILSNKQSTFLADATIYAKWTANELIFDGKTITKTWLTSAQSETFTAATNGAGPYTYTEKSEKNSSGTSTNYISVSGTTITIAGSTPAGTYTYVVNVTDQTTGSTKDVTFTIVINKAASSITCTNKNYTGSSQSLVSASSYCGSISNGSQTNAGTYTVTCNGDSNHNNSTCTGKINKVDASLSCANKTWNGSSQTIATCSGGTLSNHTRTAAGSQTVTCTGDSNHNTVTATCSINKANSSITCTNKNYTGSSQSLVSSSSYCGSISNGNQTNVGTYTVTCNGDSNHNNSTCTGKINKVDASLSCANKTWNGSSQTIATCSGGTLSNHTRTAAGSQTVTCTGDSNHNTVTASCSINKANSSITCTNKNYTGSSQSLVSASSYCGSISNGNQTNAGTYTVTCNGDSNHNNSTCTGKINKVDASLSCANKTWNGSSQTIATCSGGTLLNHTRTAAGSQTVTCIGDSNHNTVTASCSINKANSSITCTNKNYTGSSQSLVSASSYCGSISNGNQTNAGTYTVTCNGDSNHNNSTCTGIVNKINATITCSDKYWNGSSQTIASCSGGTISNHNQTNVGSYTITCTGDSNHNTVTKTCKILDSVAINTSGSTTTGYASLQAAINASTGGTTKLLKNTNEQIVISSSTNKTLNLNGKTITAIENNGTITINNGTVKGPTAWTLWNKGTMTLTDVNIEHTSNDNGCAVMNQSKLTINSGTLKSTVHVVVTHQALTTINNATLYAPTTGSGVTMWNRYHGTTYINGGSITGGSVCAHEYCAAYNDSSFAFDDDKLVLQNVSLASSTRVFGRVFTTYSFADAKLVGVFNVPGTHCPTWASSNGQDDIQWYEKWSSTNSYAESGDGLYCLVYKSLHGNSNGEYITHFYDNGSAIGGITWWW